MQDLKSKQEKGIEQAIWRNSYVVTGNLLSITLDSCRCFVPHFTLAFLQIFIVLYTCIALQTSVGLDAILDCPEHVYQSTSSVMITQLIEPPISSNFCETQLFRPVTRNTPTLQYTELL